MAGVTRFGSVLLGLLAGSILAVASCSSADDRAQAHYKRGLGLLADGDPIKATLEFRNALKLNDDFTEALFQLGVAEDQQGHFETAAKVFLSITEKDSEHLEARVRLAYVLLAGGRIDLARKFAEQATAIAEDDPRALVAKATVELKLDNRGEAIRLARLALNKNPEDIDATMVLASERILASDLVGSLAFLNQAPTASERNIGFQLLRLSVLDRLDDQPGVEALLRRLSEQFPENSAFPLSLIKWYGSKGREEDAEAAMRQLATKYPNDDKIQLGFLALLREQSGTDAAVEEAAKIIAAREESNGDTFDIRMTIAQLQFEEGAQTEAMNFMHSVIDGAKNEANRNLARIQLAKMAAYKKEWGAAESLTTSVLEDDGKNVDALRLRASIRLVEGNVDKAIDDLLAAVNEAPDDIQLHSLLGSIYERKGLVVVAGEQYAKAMDLDQKSPSTGLPYAQFLLRYGRADQALNVLESVQSKKPDDRQVLTLLAQLKLDNRDWVGAQQIADTLRQMESDQKHATADRIMAAALGGQNKLDESIDLLQASLSTYPGAPGMLADLVRSYVKADRLPEAEALLKQTLMDDPSNVEAHILLGSVYTLTARQDLAQQAFIDGAKVEKSGALGAAALAQFYISIGDVEAAENTANAALRTDEKNPVLRSILGYIYQQQEKFEDAIAQYELLFKSNPDSTAAANDLASLLSERRGDPDSLDRSFEIAQRFQNSQVPAFLDTLGWIYYLRGEYPAALPLLKSAAEGLPQVALVQFHLGMTMKELGQRGPAIAKLNEAVSLSPPLFASDFDKAKAALRELLQDASSPVAAADNTGKSQ